MTTYNAPDLNAGAMFTPDIANAYLYDDMLSLYDSPLHEFTADTEADYATSSSSDVAISSNFQHTITTEGGDLFVFFRGSIYASANHSLTRVGVRLDGLTYLDYRRVTYLYSAGAADLWLALSFMLIFPNLRPGDHLVEMVWSNGSGHTITLHAGGGGRNVYPQFVAWEM